MDPEAARTDYEVFLSFRGPDTRQGFADVLYDYIDRAGIRIFRDDDELAIGDKIETILQAVDSSLICVPVFSKTFASSKWCLAEVKRMVELNKDVVPIFYDVTPNDVDLKTPVYREFMAAHENALGKSTVEEWKNALKAITKFKGREVLTMSYTKFCKMFVEELLIKLKPRKRFPLDNLVGMDAQLESAIKLLDIDAGGVRYILIHGMGGIGKTTLAKAIFNRLSASFDSWCFLENLRESLDRDGLHYWQKQLLYSLDPKSATTSGLSRDTGERFHGKKVLVILDDIDAGEQIEKLVMRSWFSSGSRIVITSRNINVLNECERLDEDCVQSLEMTTLKDDEALRLFTLHTFQQDFPPPPFKDLSREAISAAGGLPLALKEIASLVRRKNDTIWKHVISRSRVLVTKDVKKRLMISYNALDPAQQQIFLDIACFFIGTEKSNPCYMWEACDLDPVYGLEVLVSLSLVKITEKNVIWMHDQLRDLGRDIVREQSINNPMKRSRLWLQEDAVKVLMGKEGKQAVEALSVRMPVVNTLTDEHFSSFKNIRFIQFAGAKFEGNSTDLLENLMWLSWHLCPTNFNLSNFCLENLVILDLSHSLIDENWGGWSRIHMAKNLKVLELKSCHNLTCTPDFAEVHTLERLILSQCSQLATLGSSISNLRSLKFLDLTDCYSLQCLPEELCLLKDLEEIVVKGNCGPFMFSMPKSMGNLKSLISLKLEL